MRGVWRAKGNKCRALAYNLRDPYAILISAVLDFRMHLMEEKRYPSEIHSEERFKTPVHPGSGTLRRAIRANIVSFPSQIPSFPKGPQADMQRRMVLLFFVRGWRVADIAERFQVPIHRVWKVLNEWSVRALALGYVQVIDPEAFAECCRADVEYGTDQDTEPVRVAEGRVVLKSVLHALPDVAPGGTEVGRGPVDSPVKSSDLIAALDVAIAHSAEWRGEVWVHTATLLRDLRLAAVAALEVGQLSEPADGLLTAFHSGKSSVQHGLQARGEERVSHAVA